MNILFITSYPLEYNTSGNLRNLGLIEGLLANGCSVSTYSPYPTDLALFSGKLLNLAFKKRYWIGGIPETIAPQKVVSNKHSVIAKLKGFLYKIYNYFMIYDRRSLLLRRVSASDFDQTFDVMISSSDPKSVHLFAEQLRKQNPNIAKKWIQYWGDPFSGDISYKRFLGDIRIKREEKRLLSIADKAIYVSPFTADEIRLKHESIRHKIEFYPIPYRLSQTPAEVFNFNHNEVVFGYMGDYNSFNRNILPLYNTLKKTNVRSYIIGNSDLSLEPSENLTVKQRLNGSEFSEMTKSVNVIACVCNLKGTQIPGKIYHYVNTGKPILIIVDGDRKKEMRQYFESFNRYYICDNSESSIEKCIQRIIQEKKIFDVPVSLNPKSIADKIIR